MNDYELIVQLRADIKEWREGYAGKAAEVERLNEQVVYWRGESLAWAKRFAEERQTAEFDQVMHKVALREANSLQTMARIFFVFGAISNVLWAILWTIK